MADIDLVRKQWTSSSSFLSAFFILLCTLRGKRICNMEKAFGPLCLVCVCLSICEVLSIVLCGFWYAYVLCVKKFLELLCFNRGASVSTIKETLVTHERLSAKMRRKLGTDFKDDL